MSRRKTPCAAAIRESPRDNPAEAGIAESSWSADGIVQALQAYERQRIAADERAGLVVGHVRRDQLVLRVGVDAVEARPHDLGAHDAQVHFSSTRTPQHLDELLRRVAAHDGIVDDHEALAAYDRRQRIQLDADAHLAHLLRGLDERAAHVAVLHDAVAVGNAAFLGIAERGRNARVGNAEHHVRICWNLAREDTAHAPARMVHDLSIEHAIGPREVHVFEYAARPPSRLDTLLGLHPRRAYLHDLTRLDIAHEFAPTASRPQVSLATTQPRPSGSSPSDSGRIPLGSRKALEGDGRDQDDRIAPCSCCIIRRMPARIWPVRRVSTPMVRAATSLSVYPYSWTPSLASHARCGSVSTSVRYGPARSARRQWPTHAVAPPSNRRRPPWNSVYGQLRLRPSDARVPPRQKPGRRVRGPCG